MFGLGGHGMYAIRRTGKDGSWVLPAFGLELN